MISSKPTLEMCDVRVIYPSGDGHVEVLKGIDLKANAAETIGIVGASGAGKTTLMMVAAGLTQPQNGEVLIKDHALVGKSETALTQIRAENIGIVFQNFHLIPSMTALENVMIPLEFADVENAEALSKAQLKEVGLGHRLHHYPSQLSGGEQQRVALARAVVRKPALILADEPTGNLDLENGKLMMDILFKLSEQRGTTLILITHDPEVASLCSRLVRMSDGRILDAKGEKD